MEANWISRPMNTGPYKGQKLFFLQIVILLHLCRSRKKNMIWYGVLGGKELVNRTYKNLDRNVQLEVCMHCVAICWKYLFYKTKKFTKKETQKIKNSILTSLFRGLYSSTLCIEHSITENWYTDFMYLLYVFRHCN